MAYSKAREERKWIRWKESEEKELRRLGVSEDVIQRLHRADWDDYKAERRYFEHSIDTDTYIEQQASDDTQVNILTVQNLLDEIDNKELHKLLLGVDKLTLQIVIWKTEGYSSAEISQKCDLSINAIDLRIWHLKRKIKNIF